MAWVGIESFLVRLVRGFMVGAAGWAALVAGGACGDSTGPSGGARVIVVRGAGQTDTAMARLAHALVIEVRDTTGAVARAEPVRFEALPADSAPHLPSVYLAALFSSIYSTFVADSTDGGGRAAVLVQLGFRAGRGRVLVTVPRLGLRDTVSFSVVPAAAAYVVAAPADTAAFVGGRAVLRSHVTDAYGNARADPVTYEALTAHATVDSAGVVTGVAIGRAAIAARTGGRADTTWVSVVPPGTIAALRFDPGGPGSVIVTLRLDGSQLTTIPGSQGENQYLSWSPAGTSILFYRPGYGGHVYEVEPNGSTRRVVPAASGFWEENWPRYAANGSHIFFRAVRVEGQAGWIWRIRPDGTGLDSLPVLPESFATTQPGPAPDGSRVVYVSAEAGANVLRLHDFGSGITSRLGPLGSAPHWSPTGEWIAFMVSDFNAVRVVRPDGSEERVISPTPYHWAFDWSPDGRWLVVRSVSSLDLVEVSSGLTLPLAFTSQLTHPAWKP